MLLAAETQSTKNYLKGTVKQLMTSGGMYKFELSDSEDDMDQHYPTIIPEIMESSVNQCFQHRTSAYSK